MTGFYRRIDAFWARHPALFIGFLCFLGALCSLNSHIFTFFDLLLIPFVFLFFSSRRLLWAIFLFFVAFSTTSLRVRIPSEPTECSGKLIAEVVDRRLVTIHGKSLWKGMLAVHSFSSPDGTILLKGVSVPVSIPLPCSAVGGNLYHANARLLVDEQLKIRLRPFFAKDIKAVRRVFSFVEFRVLCKRALEKVFVRLFPDHSLCQVAGGLTFGLYKDPLIQQGMHRAGVEHVLAVSGFHFGIVAGLTVFLARKMAPKRRAILSMVFLTMYLLVIGPLPSVLRAWIASMIVLGGICLDRRASGLNCLGVGLIAAVIYDPASIQGVGFQLSFLATAAILLFSRLTQNLLRRAFPQRTAAEVIHFSRPDQILLLLLEWFLPALSLLLPVFCVVCPYQLAFLQDFSLLGVVYNLIIPALFSLAMPAVLLAVLFYPLPGISHVCAFLAEIPLRLGMVLVENVPETSWGMVLGNMIPHIIGCCALLGLFLTGMICAGNDDAEGGDAWKACL